MKYSDSSVQYTMRPEQCCGIARYDTSSVPRAAVQSKSHRKFNGFLKKRQLLCTRHYSTSLSVIRMIVGLLVDYYRLRKYTLLGFRERLPCSQEEVETPQHVFYQFNVWIVLKPKKKNHAFKFYLGFLSDFYI